MSVDYVLKEKIRIGISACNIGAKVRWNQRGWDRVEMLERVRNDYVWTPVCPEVSAGLGVPRAPIRLVSGNGDDVWFGKARVKNRLGRDVSQELRSGSDLSLTVLKAADVEAFAFMEGSPSCGVYRTTLKEKRLGRPPGVFGSLLLKQDYFLIPALDLESPWKWWDWSRRLHAYVWLRRREIASKDELYEIWHRLKFICQESNLPASREIGQRLAGAPKKLTQPFIREWKGDVLQLLRTPSTLRRIQAVMSKHYAHYRKQLGLRAADVRVPSTEEGKRVFIEKLQQMEKQAFEQGYHFAGHPIVYHPPR